MGVISLTCKNCGADITSEDKFCPVCGVPTVEKKMPHFCIHCGANLTPGDKFCPGCGCPIGEPKSPAQAQSGNISASRLYYKPHRRVMDIKSAISVTLLLLCAGAFLAGTLLNWWRL